MNSTELLIWARIRGRRIDGWKFRRQQPIGPYVVDFYCAAARLIVEVNGPAHDDDSRWAYDMRRKAWLEAMGYRVHPIPVAEITRCLDDVMHGIYCAIVEQEHKGCVRRPHRPASPATSPQAGKS